MSNEFVIYRLCRDSKTIQKLKKQEQEYFLPKSIYITGPDYFDFINRIIEEAKTDYILVCHEDVILPESIREHVEEAISRSDLAFGTAGWGIIGNAGVSWENGSVVHYLSDPHSQLIPPKQTAPTIASHLDGNTLLINVKNIRTQNITLPSSLSGFHLYDFVLVSECYKAGLVCSVDFHLYATHLSQGDQYSFDKAVKKQSFQDYMRESYLNERIISINGPIDIEQKYDNAFDANEKRADYYELIRSAIRKSNKDTRITLYLGIRTTLLSSSKLKRCLENASMLSNLSPDNMTVRVIVAANELSPQSRRKIHKVSKSKKDALVSLLEEYENLDYQVFFLEQKDVKGKYPRVAALETVVREIIAPPPNTFIWFVDEDDFVLPPIVDTLALSLDERYLYIGDSIVFEEEWENSSTYPSSSTVIHEIKGHKYYKALEGDNHVPICSIIYPHHVLKNVFDENRLRGDYYEDYAIFLSALKFAEPKYIKGNLTGISRHGANVSLEKDRTHWNYSFTTFISDSTPAGVTSKASYDLAMDYLESQRKHGQWYKEYEMYSTRKIWKIFRIIAKVWDKGRHILVKSLVPDKSRN